ncbi:3-phosphoshikimate 1-carboxyvinyltransferase [Patescibacteria group bacterium]
MKAIIWPTLVKGEIQAPASKSFTHRAIILACLSKGQSVIKNCLLADDTINTLKACQKLGVNITVNNKVIKVIGRGRNLSLNPQNRLISVGNSGTTMRLITSMASLAKQGVVITGNKSLCKRPMLDLITALKDLGIKIRSTNNIGYPPIEILNGTLVGGTVKISGKISSQFISSLLLISPFAKKDVIIKITDDLKSKPYIKITLEMMKKFGVRVKNKNFQEFYIKAGQRYQGTNYQVDGDFSSASYFFAAAAICQSKIIVTGLNPNSCQGDKYLLTLLEKMGCQVKKGKQKITLMGGKELKGISVNMKNYPDIVQSLAMVAVLAKGKTVMKDIEHLRYKESDRIKATATELRKMNVKVETTKSSITVYSSQPVGAKINTYNDHRMAMCFTVLGLKAKGKTVINNADVVSKSYPNFYKRFKKLGAKIKLE